MRLARAARSSPTFLSKKIGIDIGADPAPDVDAWVIAPYDLARPRVVHRRARRAKWYRISFAFMNTKHFESRPGRIEVRHMQCVPVAQSGREKTRAIIVDNH